MAKTALKLLQLSLFLVTFTVTSYGVSQAAFPWMTGDGNSVPTLAPVLKEAVPAVVNIAVKSRIKINNNTPDLFDDPMFRRFFGDQLPGNVPNQPREEEIQGVGSGVIVDAGKGYVVTNNHVVDGATEIYVILKDKRRLPAEVVGSDDETDIAVLKMKGDHLTAMPIGSSSDLQVGDFVLAIGNPFGLGHTVTSGIVSALGRSGLGIEGYEDFIQTDASINPGNSGGALINLKGELVGVNTAILSRSGGNVGIGFAIPIEMVRGVMDQLIAGGKIERGQLGILIQDLTPDIAEALNINEQDGAVVAQVQKDSPAEKAGIKNGDVVVAFNGKPIAGASGLKNQVGFVKVGEKVTLDVYRDGAKKTFTVAVGKRDGKPGPDGRTVEGEHKLLKGGRFSAIPDTGDDKTTKGVYVASIEPDSPAARSGLREGDIIISCNQQDVSTPAELFKAAAKNAKALLLNIRRGDGALFIVIRE